MNCKPSLRLLAPLMALGVSAWLGACTAGVGEDDGDDPIEPTAFELTVESVGVEYPFLVSGVFGPPEGVSGPLPPGASYVVEFSAPPGSRLSFATMFVPSNDLFFAPAGQGIALFEDDGQPRSGDVTAAITLWDAGTEINEDLGLGPSQAQSQPRANLGDPDPDSTVRPASESYPNLPAVDALIGVTLTPGEGNSFVLTIENRSDMDSLVLSDDTTTAVSLAPGVFMIHTDPDPLFGAGTSDRAAGLEALVEDGDPSALAATLAPLTGVVSPLAPGLWSVHAPGEGLFEVGQPEPGQGLEALAEDGDPAALEQALSGQNIGVFGGVYDEAIAPLLPGQAFILQLEARPGEHLSFVSMFAQSNDIFLGTGAEGIALFDADGAPLSGDISAQLDLWDAGTELNEAPGAGPNQAARQPGPDVGVDEDGVVGLVDDGYVYPAPTELVRVILTPS